jgi:signal transduction histidine kinase
VKVLSIRRAVTKSAATPISGLQAFAGPKLGDWMDAVVAAALAAAAVVSLRVATVPPDGREPDIVAYSLALALTLPLAFRRRWPIPVLGIMLLGSLIYAARGYPSANVDFFGPVVAFYTVAAQTRRATSIAAGAALWLAVLVSVAVSPTEAGDGSAVLTGAVIIVAVWLFGDSVRQRREYAKQLEAARQELADQAVTQERLRIARDLHDIVAHSIGTIVVQSSVARDAIDVNQEAARQAIEHVQGISRSAMGEVRQLLGVLRLPDERRAPPSPSPKLAELSRLIAEAENGGITVQSSISGEESTLPAAVDLAAYRIVQEALTNVVKHASGSHASVTLHYRKDALTIEIVNGIANRSGGRPVLAVDRGGLGIDGMRERVSLLGGRFVAGPRDEGGFRIEAVLPLSVAE